MDKYSKRLIREWIEYGKIIVAVDFDDTINPWGFTSDEDKKDFERIAKLLKEVRLTGAWIVIHTACDKDRYDDIRKICSEVGIKIDTINQNPIDLPYGNDRKIYANIFLDDRAGLNEALNMLEGAMYIVRAKKESDKGYQGLG